MEELDDKQINDILISEAFQFNNRREQDDIHIAEERDNRIRATINIIKLYRKDIFQAVHHECDLDYCHPMNINNIKTCFISEEDISKFYDGDTYVCKYGKVHICDDSCLPPDGTPCLKTGKRIEKYFSQFRTHVDQIEVYEAPHAHMISLYNSYEKSREQDMKWNKENPIYNQHVTGKIKNPRKKRRRLRRRHNKVELLSRTRI